MTREDNSDTNSDLSQEKTVFKTPMLKTDLSDKRSLIHKAPKKVGKQTTSTLKTKRKLDMNQ